MAEVNSTSAIFSFFLTLDSLIQRTIFFVVLLRKTENNAYAFETIARIIKVVPNLSFLCVITMVNRTLGFT